MATLLTLGWTYKDNVWRHEETGRVVEIKGDIIEVYQISGQNKFRGWLTTDEYNRFWTVLNVK